MQQYHELLKTIKEKGTYKPPARENMPGTLSLFGYQNRYDLQNGFPILTTKKVNFKHIVVELLWFLKGDTNVKYLIDNGCNIWNEDAYNYYKKKYPKSEIKFDDFIDFIKNPLTETGLPRILFFEQPADNYTLGDCGKQYGWLWRKWDGGFNDGLGNYYPNDVDQIKDLIKGLKSNPMGRRHIVTAWNPSTLDDMALNACHAFVQFNCRLLSDEQRKVLFLKQNAVSSKDKELLDTTDYDNVEIPRYYLDCQMYQRSADSFLGVPYNIASYALLTHILAKICNMVPGDFIHSFGDVHIYDNHMEAVDEILTRTPTELPTLVHMKTDDFWKVFDVSLFGHLDYGDFLLENYNPQSLIKAKLSTGLK